MFYKYKAAISILLNNFFSLFNQYSVLVSFDYY